MDSMESVQSDVTYDSMCNPPAQPAMKSRITSLVDHADLTNVKLIADQIMNEDLVAGKRFFCQTIIKSQFEYPESRDVYAALVAMINPNFPEVGYLLVKRAVLQFKAAHDSGNRKRMQASSQFLARLVNRRVVYEHLAETVLMLLLVNPSSDNVRVAASFCSECGALLMELLPRQLQEILGEFRRVLIECAVEKRVRVSIRRLFAVAKRWEFEELDFVDEYQVTHEVSLLQDIDSESSIDDLQQEFGDVSEDDECSSRAPPH